jgi:hypothetical protein
MRERERERDASDVADQVTQGREMVGKRFEGQRWIAGRIRTSIHVPIKKKKHTCWKQIGISAACFLYY